MQPILNSSTGHIILFDLFSLPAAEGRSFLSFQKGDLIILENETGEAVMTSGWCKGTCERTGKQGDFPSEAVYVLPTMDQPSAEILVSLLRFVAFY